MIRLALRNLLVRKRRTLFTALAVVVGVAQVTGAFVLTDSMNSTIDKLFKTGQGGVDVVVTPAGTQTGRDRTELTLPSDLEQKVRAVKGVRIAGGEVFALVAILKPNGKPVSMGPPSFVLSQPPQTLNTWRLRAGRWAKAGEAVLDQSTAKRVGFKVGDRLPIVGAKGIERPRISGIASLGNSSLAGATIAITPLQDARRLGDRAGRYDRILIGGQKDVDASTLRADVKAALRGDKVTVRTGQEQAANQASELKSQLGFLQPILLAFGIIALFVGSFVIVNTFSATLAQRSQELALLRALGATRKQVTRSVLLESVLIGLIAGVLGLGGGLLLAPALLGIFKSFGADLPNNGTVIELRTILVALIVGPLVTGLAGLLPVRRAAAVPPIQAMRGDSVRDGARRPGVLAWLTALLAVGAIVSALTTSGGAAAVSLGAGAILTLVAVAALAPLVLAPLMRVLGAPLAATGMSGRLARLNAARQPRRTATTAGALMVGVALVTFVSVFAAGLSSIAKDAFSNRVRANLGISDSGQNGFPQRADELVAGDPGVARVVGLSYGGFNTTATGDGLPFVGVDRGLSDVYGLKWVKGNDALLDQLGPQEVIADRGADDDRIATARVGEKITVRRPDGTPLVFTVRGIVDEGSTLLGKSLIGRRDVMASGGAPSRLQFALVRLKGGVDATAVQKRLQRTLKVRFPTVEPLTKKELEKRFVGQINQLVNLIYVFLAFALVVSLLGISTTFTLTVQERRRELGMMRAIGATRRQIRRLVRLEAVLTGLLGGVLGVGVGLGFGAIAARLLKDDGFSYVVPGGTVITVLIISAVVAALAATMPARRAGRIDIVKALSVE